jgi:hypothetical protein
MESRKSFLVTPCFSLKANMKITQPERAVERKWNIIYMRPLYYWPSVLCLSSDISNITLRFGKYNIETSNMVFVIQLG